MRRIVIVGSYGAGKTTLARRLGATTGFPVHHLDALRWQAGWVARPREAWLADLVRLLEGSAWIVEGNFELTLEERLRRCDTAIFLDFPTLLSARRMVRRRLSSAPRPDLPPGCRERLNLRMASLLWGYAMQSRPAIVDLLDRYEASIDIVVLRCPAEVERFARAAGIALPRADR